MTNKLTPNAIKAFVDGTSNFNLGTKGLVPHFYNFVGSYELDSKALELVSSKLEANLSVGAFKKDMRVITRLNELKSTYKVEFDNIGKALEVERLLKLRNLEVLTKVLALCLEGETLEEAYLAVNQPKVKTVPTFKRDSLISLIAKLGEEVTKEEILELLKA